MEPEDDPTFFLTVPGGVIFTFASLGAQFNLPPYVEIPIKLLGATLGVSVTGASFYYGTGLYKTELARNLKNSVKTSFRKIKSYL